MRKGKAVRRMPVPDVVFDGNGPVHSKDYALARIAVFTYEE